MVFFGLCYFNLFISFSKVLITLNFVSITKNEPCHFILVSWWYFPMLQQGDEYTSFYLVKKKKNGPSEYTSKYMTNRFLNKLLNFNLLIHFSFYRETSLIWRFISSSNLLHFNQCHDKVANLLISALLELKYFFCRMEEDLYY